MHLLDITTTLHNHTSWFTGNEYVLSRNKLKVVLCWHMHQPQYQDLISGRHLLPWAYLHGTKDYVDMAGILEEIGQARAVVNFTPILLDQLTIYSHKISRFLQFNEAIDDPLLDALGGVGIPTEPEARLKLAGLCLHANETHMIQRYPAYQQLVELTRLQLDKPGLSLYLNDQFLADLLVWYHLAWLGETVKRSNQRAQALLTKGSGYTEHDRRTLLEIIGELLSDIIPRFRRLQQTGQIELSVSPQDHPMLPLLLDFAAARDAEPDIPLPDQAHYPDGETRLQWHVSEGLRTFQQHFGFKPAGCWPSEGGVSNKVLNALSAAGFCWFATGERVLDHSLDRYSISTEAAKHRAYRIAGFDGSLFFRDDQLSDLIGFSYASWHAADAVADFIHHLEARYQACQNSADRVVSVILDGENAWETYPHNGYEFLTRLYQALVQHPDLELTTFADCLAGSQTHGELPGIVAGSWVYGTFSTWIGSADKNRAWDLLCQARQRADAVLADPERNIDRELVLRQLGVCEASDWFWWLGDYHSEESVTSFEGLYRHHLKNLYLLLGDEPPETLRVPVSRGSGHTEPIGTMRRSS